MMKIALICGGISSGGLYSLLSDILCYAPSGNIELILFCSEAYIKPYKHINPKIKIHLTDELLESKFSSLYRNRYSEKFIKLIDSYFPDAIFFISGSCKKGLEKYNTFIVLHNQLYTSISKIFAQLDLKVTISTLIFATRFYSNIKGIKHIIYSSNYSKLESAKCYKGIKSTVIPLSLNSKFYNDLPITRKELNNNEIFLLNIGSITPYKNQLAVIEALRILKNKGINFKATFVGRVISKPYYVFCKLKIKKYGLGEYIQMIEWVELEKIPALIDSCDIYINSSITDTCGTSVEEGMARFKPVIASDTLFNREKVCDDGLYFNLKNPTELANKIIKYINDKELRDKNAVNGHIRTTTWSLFDTAQKYYDYIISETNK